MNQESSRLRETIVDWQEKVGIEFDIDDFESDSDEIPDDGLEEFD